MLVKSKNFDVAWGVSICCKLVCTLLHNMCDMFQWF
jgi:hypothetical protein